MSAFGSVCFWLWFMFSLVCDFGFAVCMLGYLDGCFTVLICSSRLDVVCCLCNCWFLLTSLLLVRF